MADGGDAAAVLVVAFEELGPARYAAVALAAGAAGEQHLAADLCAGLEHLAFDLVAGAHVRGDLEHAAASAGFDDSFLDGAGFAGVRPGAGGEPTVRHAVAEEAGGGEAGRAALHGLLDQLDDALQLALIRLHALVAALVAHRLEANGRVAAHADHVQRRIQRLHAVQIFAEGGPVPRQAVHDGIGGDVLHRLHELGEVAPVVLAARREGDAAVADQRRRDAVVGAGPHLRIPADLGIEVRVQIDEAGRDQAVRGIDGLRRLGVAKVADAADAAAVDGDVGTACFAAGTVDDGAAGDQQVMGHG